MEKFRFDTQILNESFPFFFGSENSECIGYYEEVYKPVEYKPDYRQIFIDLLRNYLKVKVNDLSSLLPDDLKRSYLFFSKLIHPDLNKEDSKANEKFVGLRKAYEQWQITLFGSILNGQNEESKQ